MTPTSPLLPTILRNVDAFAAIASGVPLRSYQIGVARAICESVLRGKGYSFVVIFPRQSGKNELQAQIETYLLCIFQNLNADLVKVSPTWKPQSLNAMRRLERVLRGCRLLGQAWRKEMGYIYRVGSARISFLSGSPPSNVVGATANTLLECDEAQDVLIAKWDKEINPMAASTNATRVFYGTAWTSQTLLARELRVAQQAEQRDGVRRVFRINAGDVAREVPAYGAFVQAEIERHGSDNPFIRSQYGSEEIDAHGGMFPPARQALMRGSHPPLDTPPIWSVDGGSRRGVADQYAFLLDIAGEDESISQITQNEVLSNLKRDSTALTIVRIDLSLLEALHAPRYQVVGRRVWTGIAHTNLFGQIVALAETWQPRYLVCDSTGVGAGLASFLSKTLGAGRVIPFVFSLRSKSKLGWGFLSAVETGRFSDHAPSGSPEQALFWRQVENAQEEIIPGPGKLLRWGVPDGAHDPRDGAVLHDDLLVSAALCAVLDEQPWGLSVSAVVPATDPLAPLGSIY